MVLGLPIIEADTGDAPWIVLASEPPTPDTTEETR
jgi:hypothetical protein